MENSTSKVVVITGLVALPGTRHDTGRTVQLWKVETRFDFCEKVKAEQTRLFRRLVGGQGKGTMHLLIDDWCYDEWSHRRWQDE